MQTTFLLVAAMAIFAMANPAPSAMGVEVIREDGLVIVREVVSYSDMPT